MKTELIYDLVVLAILALALIRGWRRGFILTLCSLLAVFVALIGARLAADAFTPAVSDVLRPRLEAIIDRQLAPGDKTKGADGPADAAPATPAPAPAQSAPAQTEPAARASALDVLKSLGFYDGLSKTIDRTVRETSASLAAAAADTVARILVFCVSFVLILLLWRLVSKLLDLTAKLPVLHELNGLLGGALGLAEGALFLFLLAWVLRLAGGVIPQETVEKTTLLRFFVQTNPMELFAGAGR